MTITITITNHGTEADAAALSAALDSAVEKVLSEQGVTNSTVAIAVD